MSKMKVGLSLGGNAKVQRDVMDIVQNDSKIGVAVIDRGSKVWDEAGGDDGQGDWVHVPEEYEELSLDLVVNEGKGYGSQTISEDDLEGVAEALAGIIAADFQRPEPTPETYQPPGEVVANSWRMVFPKKDEIDPKTGKMRAVRDRNHPEGRCLVSFRTRNGRGAKPVEIHRDRLPELLGLTQNLGPAFDAQREVAWANYEAYKAAAEAARLAKLQADSGGSDD